MSNFILDNLLLPYPKTDRAALGASLDPTQHVTASEWNLVCQDLSDLRGWVISGSYTGYVSSSGMPNVQMGTSGTVGAMWLSSTLHPYFSVTSSDGFVTRKIAMAPTGTNVWTGYFSQVLVDEQGIVVSGTTGGGSGGYATIKSGSSETLPTETVLLIAAGGLSVYDDSVNSLTRLEHTSGTLGVGAAYSSPTALTLDDYGHISAITQNGTPTYASITASDSISTVNITGSGAKFQDLEVTRNFTVPGLTGSSLKSTLDLEATRYLYVSGGVMIGGDRLAPSSLFHLRASGSDGEVILDRTAAASTHIFLRLRQLGSNVARIGINSSNQLIFGQTGTGLTVADGTVTTVAQTVNGTVTPGADLSYTNGTAANTWSAIYTREIYNDDQSTRINLNSAAMYVTGAISSSAGLKLGTDISASQGIVIGEAITAASSYPLVIHKTLAAAANNYYLAGYRSGTKLFHIESDGSDHINFVNQGANALRVYSSAGATLLWVFGPTTSNTSTVTLNMSAQPIINFGGLTPNTALSKNIGSNSLSLLGTYAQYHYGPGTGSAQGIIELGHTNEQSIKFYASGTVAFTLSGSGLLQNNRSANEQTTIGAAGGASAPPASPEKYWLVKASDGIAYAIPMYLAS